MAEYCMAYMGSELDSAINKVKNNYVDKKTTFYVASGVVSNVTSGQEFSVSGIKDDKTGQTFDVKGVFACIEPTATTTYSSYANKPSLVAFYNASVESGTVIIAGTDKTYSVRAGCNSSRLTFSGSRFTFMADQTMYGVMSASKWRWVAWG